MAANDSGYSGSGGWLNERTYRRIASEISQWPQWKRDAYSSIKGSTNWSGSRPSSGNEMARR